MFDSRSSVAFVFAFECRVCRNFLNFFERVITFEKSVTKSILENVMIRFQMNNCKTNKLETFQRYQGTVSMFEDDLL